jgi:CAAX protease family protein
MGKAWKSAGLAFVNLLVIACFIGVSQGWLQRHFDWWGAAVLALLCFVLYVGTCKLIERREPMELAANRALPELGAGLIAGLLLFSALMGILWLAGAYHPAGIAGATPQVAKGFVLALFAGILEELLFRGLLFRMFSTLFGTWGALGLTSALFGAAHLANRGATLTSGIAIALEAGLLLGSAYAATRRLWLPIGLHIGWNFSEGSIFGMSVSGGVTEPGLIRGSLSGREVLTGGAFGPEASIVAVLLGLALSIYFMWRVVKLRLAEPPMWRRTMLALSETQAAEPVSN